MHMWIAPYFLWTTTIPAHHGVGLSTLEIIPSDSICFSSCSTLECNGRGMFLEVNNAYGCASGFSWISSGSPKLPPVLGTVLDTFRHFFHSFLYLATRSSARIAGRPSRFIFRSFTTYTGWFLVFPWWDNSPSNWLITFNTISVSKVGENGQN